MTRLLTLLTFLAAIVLAPREVSSQEARYRWEIGAQLGMSGYTGDANSGFMFRSPGFAASALGRYVFDSRWALRIQAGMMTLSGDTQNMNTALPSGENYSFHSTLGLFEARGEFNFFPYGIGETYKRLRRWTPFVSLGLSGGVSSSDGKSYGAFGIPVGIGVKFKPRERLNLGIELTVAKTLSDHLDGEKLSDLYMIKSSFFKNTDTYSALTISLTYEFGERCTVCNRID